jgi:tRNA(adenine34) deaminase
MTLDIFSDEYYMKEALKEAYKALEMGEIPVGAVVVCNQTIVGRGHNLTEQLNDSTAHAEMQALTAAMNHMGSKYLKGCSLFVTLEPCVMCAGAAHWAQLERIVFGATDPKKGFRVYNEKILHPKSKIISGLLARESETLLEEFFRKKRS